MADPTSRTTGHLTVADAEAEVQQSREQLAETVRALGERTDVKARTRDRVATLRRDHGTALAGAGAGLVVLVVALTVVRHRR